MTIEEKRQLKKGDFITWRHGEHGWKCYGRILNDGDDFCDLIRGDGTQDLTPGDFFFASSPDWVDAESITKVEDTTLIELLKESFGYQDNEDKSSTAAMRYFGQSYWESWARDKVAIFKAGYLSCLQDLSNGKDNGIIESLS